MAPLSYHQPGLTLQPGSGTPEQTKSLQRDLRALGYLRQGVDGDFGLSTTRAIKALQYDLLHNHGETFRNDGGAPVAIADYNHGHVENVTGFADQRTVQCISDMLDDPRFPKLPLSQNAAADNRGIIATLNSLPSSKVAIPFLLAILNQESGLRHFSEPTAHDADSFIVVGLDTNAGEKHIVTSRGYGVGQYTLFHHPPRADEVDSFMRDPTRNVSRAVDALRDKFDHFVAGKTAGTSARDRIADTGAGSPRPCKFDQHDPRYLRDCANCLRNAGSRTIKVGDPLFPGASSSLETTQYYKTASYTVPDCKNIPCDWPYAARRYNGDGVNSYHYQFRILQFVANPPKVAAAASASSGT